MFKLTFVVIILLATFGAGNAQQPEKRADVVHWHRCIVRQNRPATCTRDTRDAIETFTLIDSERARLKGDRVFLLKEVGGVITFWTIAEVRVHKDGGPLGQRYVGSVCGAEVTENELSQRAGMPINSAGCRK